jgi:uncharacterized glyoxalase superfamily protein PhnB
MPNDRTMPPSTIFPVLVYQDVGEAARWLCDVFGFSLRWIAGNHRAQLAFGDGAVMLGELGDGLRPPQPGEDSVMVRVADVDRHHEQAVLRGAQVVKPPADYPYGERQYTAADPAGRRWTFSQSIADVAPEDWGGTSG